jgi:hypothetical protein
MEESVLQFIDPNEERKAQFEKEKQMKKKEVPMLKTNTGAAMHMP